MIVVSDTTPVHYLILIGKETVLPELFDKIIIPAAVIKEMCHAKAPAEVRAWAAQPPAWAAVEVGDSNLISEIDNVGAGESAAIAIGIEFGADAVLMDDRKAIREAAKRNLTVLTTFALLELAARKKLPDFSSAIDELSKTSFHLPPEEIVEEYLRRNS